jgi:hypothetical protein
LFNGGDLSFEISFDKEKLDKIIESIKNQYTNKPLDEKTLETIKEELRKGANDAIKIEI